MAPVRGLGFSRAHVSLRCGAEVVLAVALVGVLTVLTVPSLFQVAEAATPAKLTAGEGDPAATRARLGAEALAKLRTYLRVDTTNPPGNEAAGAELLASWLVAEGIATELVPIAPGRSAAIARLKGDGHDRPLLLLNHIDVVPADPARWTMPPFGGLEKDGVLYGRGALDMKGLGILELIAFLELKRKGVKLRRDVIFVATPDEEVGGKVGVKWLLEHRPDLVDVGEVLNEGGMGMVTPSGKALMGIQTAERGTFWVRMTAHGKPGHGSTDRPDSATRRLIRAIAKLEAAPRRWGLGPESVAMLNAFAGTESPLNAAMLRTMTSMAGLQAVGGLVTSREPFLTPIVSDTVNATVIRAGTNTNVIPGEASAELDMRILPGRTGTEALAWLKQVTAVAGDPPLDWQVLHETTPSRSAASGALWDGLVAAIADEYPGVPAMPILTPGGGTDSAFFRARGVQALGCMPVVVSQSQLDAMHGDDERISREQLARGARAMTLAVALASRLE